MCLFKKEIYLVIDLMKDNYIGRVYAYRKAKDALDFIQGFEIHNKNLFPQNTSDDIYVKQLESGKITGVTIAGFADENGVPKAQFRIERVSLN